MKDKISTPFGNFLVKQNGEPIEFNYTIKNYSSNKTSALIRLYVIEVDMKNQNITCGFEEPIFEHQTKEEHFTTLFVENEELMLGLCGVNPSDQVFSMTTNNEYGFTYHIENKITLMLCCIEKNKFKNAKRVIEKAFLNEIKLIKDITVNTKPNKNHKALITFSLFILLSLLYIAFAFVLIKYKVVTNEVLKKVGFGIAGVMMVSYALSSLQTPKQKVEKTKNKRTFVITFILLLIALIVIDFTTYILLCATGKIGNELMLAVGLTILSLVILCWFTSEYQIDKSDKKKESFIDDKKEPEKKQGLQFEEAPKKLNPIFLNISASFPKKLKEDWFQLSKKLKIQNIKVSEQTFIYQLSRETVEIPYRIEMEEVADADLTQMEKLMLYCIYTRHYDGHIREKYVKKILEVELQEWEFPFIIKLSDEYVYEILALIYSYLKRQNNTELKEFAKNNKEVLCKGYSKMNNYWNEFYRAKTLKFHNYIGRKLFRDCFGYSRKYEKKKYRCACCCNNTIVGYLINYYNEPCPVCYWRNNVEQNNDLDKIGINKISLKEAQENYKKIGAIKEEYKSVVRKPTEKESVKINIEQILKLLKLNLQEKGFERKRDTIPFYEYQNHYVRIIYQNGLFIIEKAETIEDIKNNSWVVYAEFKPETDYRKLVEQMIESILKVCKKKVMKKKTKLTKADRDKIVEEEIKIWNPLGISKKGFLDDEYHLEIKKITTKLSKLKTEKELKEHIEQVFQKLFGENLFLDKKEEIEKVTNKIWKRINKK